MMQPTRSRSSKQTHEFEGKPAQTLPLAARRSSSAPTNCQRLTRCRIRRYCLLRRQGKKLSAFLHQILYYLVTDSAHLREEAIRKFGDKLVVTGAGESQ